MDPTALPKAPPTRQHGPEPDDPFDQNAALWLNHLPRDCTVRQLIRAIISIGPTGRILFCKIVRPYLPGHSWAAKIVFATRQEAQRLLNVSRSGRFLIQGQRVFVDWHRVLSTSFQAVEPITRVLVIEGPSYIVNRPGLQAYFRRKLTRFNTEQIVELGDENGPGNRASIVWRFGSWFGQAQVAAEVIQEDYAGLVDKFMSYDRPGPVLFGSLSTGIEKFGLTVGQLASKHASGQEIYGYCDQCFVSILYLTLAQATALNFLAPLGAMVLAKYLDFGTFSIIDRVGGVVALIGIVLVVQPDSIFASDEKLSSGASKETPERLKGVVCGLVGVFGGIEALLTAGISSDASSAATVMIYSQVLWALALDRVVWHVSVNIWTLIGVGSVVCSLALVSLAKEVTKTRIRGGFQYVGITPSVDGGIRDVDMESLYASEDINEDEAA
ncbi:hypothetical protein VP1G_07372 [Cytospora mali]|uniref:Uncharacterized protein n=1 Tax=Cytospora mali TaxID=578113 RepID=A0A194V8C2_CYTMA|nr:hypothetical protein VP1G_07372 [Valsa mali var. pyri (nom. inval.)]